MDLLEKTNGEKSITFLCKLMCFAAAFGRVASCVGSVVVALNKVNIAAVNAKLVLHIGNIGRRSNVERKWRMDGESNRRMVAHGH